MSEAYDETYELSSAFRDHRRCDLRDYRRHRRNDRGLHRQFFRHSPHASDAPKFNDHNRLMLHSWGSILPDHEKTGSSTWHDICCCCAAWSVRISSQFWHFPSYGNDATRLSSVGVICVWPLSYMCRHSGISLTYAELGFSADCSGRADI